MKNYKNLTTRERILLSFIDEINSGSLDGSFRVEELYQGSQHERFILFDWGGHPLDGLYVSLSLLCFLSGRGFETVNTRLSINLRLKYAMLKSIRRTEEAEEERARQSEITEMQKYFKL